MGYFDETAEKIGDDLWDEWKKRVLEARDEIASFVAHRRCSGGDSEVVDWFEGSFNFCLRVTFQSTEPDAIIRFPGPGHTTFRDEKVTNEVHVINFLHERTNIPIPRLLSWGLTKDSPHHFGPFMISEFVDGVHLSDILKDPAHKRQFYLNPNIDERLLENVFEQMSDILLQLHQFDFPAIGAISKDHTSNTWSVTRRPLTYSMNELATTAFYPVEDFATAPFTSTSDYFGYLSRQHITHLRTQRNLSASREEAREQYIVRHLFALLIDKYTIDEHGPFKLFCDDLRPQNILVDPKTMRINAVFDLEFTNTMPGQYASEPPWWLLLAGPDSYLLRGRTLEEFQATYEPCLEQFLQAMQRVESARGLQQQQHDASLSKLMREGWATKRFWFNFAARKPFDVEEIFNSFLNDDGRGIECLEDETYGALETFVHTKMEQLKAYDEECKLLLYFVVQPTHTTRSTVLLVEDDMDNNLQRRGSTISLTRSMGGHPDTYTWTESKPANVFDPTQNAISSLLQPRIVRTGLQPAAYAPTSSLHKIPTARDIIPVALTTIPTVDTTEFQPYLQQVGSPYEQVQRLRNTGDKSIKTPGNWPDDALGGNAVPHERGGQLLSPQKVAGVPIRAPAVQLQSHLEQRGKGSSRSTSRACHGSPQLSVIPDVYFDQDFHLENPRTFHVVTEKSEVNTPNPRTVDILVQNRDGPAPRKALSTNAILQEKLSWYMDVVEVHLIDSISTASTEFFSALGALRELYMEAAESVEKVRALRKNLATLDKHLVGEGLALLQKQQIFSNLRRLNDAVAQLEHIVDGVTRSESLVDEGEVEKALAEIDAIELLMSGERDETTGSAAATDIHLRDLRGAVALQGVVGDLTVLRSRIGKLFESKVHDILLRDLQRHIHSVSTPEVLLRWGTAFQRAQGNYPREPSNFPAYMLMTDELRMALSPQISGLHRSGSISIAIETYRKLVLQEIRSVVRGPLPSSTDDVESIKSASTVSGGRARTNQEKSSILAANIRALDAADAEKLLSSIFIGVTETLRRLKTQSSVLLDLASTVRKPDAKTSVKSPTTTKPLNGSSESIQAPTFEIQEEMHVALDLSNLLGQAVDVSHEMIDKILRVRSEQTASLPVASFLRYFTLNLFFVNECEAISGRAGTSLKNIVNDHVQAFIQAHGEGKSQALTQGMDVDNWQVKDYPGKDNILLRQILESSISDPPPWADARKVWMPLSHGDFNDEARAADKVTTEDKVSGGIIDGETFLLPHSAILCLEGVSDFLRLLGGIPSRTVDIAMSLVSYIQLFDSRCRQLILGAGAMRSAGLKNITTTHLALAWQAVSFIATTIPYIRKFVRRHGPMGQSSANLMSEFDKVQRSLQEHQDAIVQKMVEIMALRAGTLCKTALETEWSKENPNDVREYMADLARDTRKLYKALDKYLPPRSVEQVMVPVFASYGEQLGNALEKADPETKTGRDCMIRDIEHLAYKLDKFEGFGDLDAQLKQIVERKGVIDHGCS